MNGMVLAILVGVLSEPAPVEQPRQPTSAVSSTAGRRQFALLESNKVVAGEVIDQGDSYIIRRAGASVTFPKRIVQFVGDSVESVYAYRSSRIPLGDLQMRAELAEWCFHERLTDRAAEEARRVIESDPSQPIARRVLKLTEPKEVRPSDQNMSDGSGKAPRLRQPNPKRVIEQFKAAYGQELFNDYKEFEPLVMASCGNAACHGGIRHEGTFRLYRRSSGGPGDLQLTSRNLTSLLNAVDFQDPLRSPLLFKALEKHGSSSLPPLGGVQDPTYVALQEWVVEVAHRWSGNEIELRPDQVPSEVIETDAGEDDETFAGGRDSVGPPRKVVKRTGRPKRPGAVPDEGPLGVPDEPLLADDAPAPPVNEMPAPPISSEQMRAEEIAQPIDPVAAPPPPPRPRGFRGAASRFVEMIGGKPRVTPTVQLPGSDPSGQSVTPYQDQGGRWRFRRTNVDESFKAATPPLNSPNLPTPLPEAPEPGP